MTHMNSDAPTVLATIVLFSSIFLILYFLQYLVDDKVYADGLSQESLPPSPIGNRELSLFVKISPSILTTENVKNTYMQFRLFNAANNRTIQHVTYEITVTRGIRIQY